MRATAASAGQAASPRRQRTVTASGNAIAATGHASYLVRQASANAMPTLAAGGAKALVSSFSIARLHQAISKATATSVSPRSSGSVIGVDCRYSTFGFNANTAAAATPAHRDPVSVATIHATAAVAAAND